MFRISSLVPFIMSVNIVFVHEPTNTPSLFLDVIINGTLLMSVLSLVAFYFHVIHAWKISLLDRSFFDRFLYFLIYSEIWSFRFEPNHNCNNSWKAVKKMERKRRHDEDRSISWLIRWSMCWLVISHLSCTTIGYLHNNNHCPGNFSIMSTFFFG